MEYNCDLNPLPTPQAIMNGQTKCVRCPSEPYDVYDWDKEPDLDVLRRLMDRQATDPARTLAGLEELAGRGSTISMVYLAHAYRNGIGADVDPLRSREWFERAAAAGSLLASYELGWIYWDAKDYEKAHRVLSTGVVRGYPPAMYLSATMYVHGLGVPLDVERAQELLEAAVAQGHVFAKRNLGVLLIKGRFGIWQIPRGILLVLSGIKDVLVLVPRDRKSERLR
jgi:TPR repeat protein